MYVCHTQAGRGGKMKGEKKKEKKGGEGGHHARVTRQTLVAGQRKLGKDGAGAKGRRRLQPALEAMADVQRQRLRERGREADGPALTTTLHFGGWKDKKNKVRGTSLLGNRR